MSAAPLRNESYSWIYRQLVTNPNDAVGAFAYILYKQEKIAFIEAIKAAQQREPTPDELHTFHTQACTQPRIDSYLRDAEQLTSEFLRAGLKKRLEDFEEEIRESVLSQKIDAISNELKARKGGKQWVADIAASLIVSVAAILVIGALLVGYQAISRFNTFLEQMIPVGAAPPGPDMPSSRD